ncbi:MAG: type IV pilus secretin PilQ [Deltaproteobacteria bacterium]|nr:type IV pilus secretin PilQ [Deltaproteobacteria bacterium]
MSNRGRFENMGSFVEGGVARGLLSRVAALFIIAACLTLLLGASAYAKDETGAGPKASALGSDNDATVIDRVEITKEGDRTSIRAYANRPVFFFAVRQQDPPAVILNLAGTQIAKPIAPFEVDGELVDKVFVTQTASKKQSSRILVTLKREVHYEVHQKPDGLVMEVSAEAAEDDLAPEPSAAKSGLDTTDIGGAETDALAKIGATPAKTETEAEASGKESPQAVQVTKAEPSEAPATRDLALPEATELTAVSVDKAATGTQVAVELNGRARSFDFFTLDNPSRLVVDVFGVQEASGKRLIPVGGPEIGSVRIGPHPGKVRIVLDLDDESAPYAIEPAGSTLLIAFGDRSKNIASAIPAATPVAAQVTEIAPEAAPRPVKPEPFKEERTAAAITPETENPALPDLEASEPIVPLATPVMAALDTEAASEIDPDEIRNPNEGVLTERPEISLGFRPGKVYHGNLVSLDFKDADIQNILRLIAEVSGLNVVAAEDVAGAVTVRLVNVPWDQALDVVLASRQLGYIRTGNILRVAPAERLKAEEAQYLADRRSVEKLEDLMVKLVPINYAKVTDAQEQVESLLSDRGSSNVDIRTNTLIIKDIPTVIEQAVKLVRRLDTQTPQVLIEAKIVEANLDFAKELGIMYTADFLNADIGNGKNAASDNVNFGNRVVNSGTSPSGSSLFSGALPIKGMPTGVASGSFTALKDQLDVDVTIQALESSGNGRVISSPRIITLDNKEAKIQQGISIPFQTTEEGDTNLEFIDADLSLTVTPHVTSDRSIIMKIKVARNAPDLSVPTATGDPAIAKNEATTEALVKDGQTVVIGGIYVVDKAANNMSIPYLNRVPGFQWLFRNYSVSDKKKELIIFVTPRIIGGEAGAA